MFGTRTSAFLKLSKRDLKYDFPASIVVFLVALPLCLGIAMASGAPLFAGLLTGIIGGVVVSSLSGSPLSVSGPAAGLTVIVLGAIEQLGGYETFILSVFLAGIIQLVLGVLRAGMIGSYFPTAVIIGMLAAIGITIILKQVPLAFGMTDASFQLNASWHDLMGKINWGATLICFGSLGVLIFWPLVKPLNKIPAPLVVVLLGVGLGMAFQGTAFGLDDSHFVQIPAVSSFQEFQGLFVFPEFAQIFNPGVWTVAITIAVIASLETLLSIEAVDKLDRFKRHSPTNRELIAQGVGNMTSGFLGGLPMTSVIVRSSANVNSGGRTRQSAIMHGLWLLLALLAIPTLINLIPLAGLAAILLHTGYKLARPTLFRQIYKKGLDQFIPFVVTVSAVVFTDLLTGVGVGILVATFYILRANFNNAYRLDLSESAAKDSEHAVFTLAEEVTFLNKAPIQQQLYSLPKNVRSVVIDGHRSKFIDKDVIDVIKDFEQNARSKGVDIELRAVSYKGKVRRTKRQKLQEIV